jgi:hypothetical protein
MTDRDNELTEQQMTEQAAAAIELRINSYRSIIRQQAFAAGELLPMTIVALVLLDVVAEIFANEEGFENAATRLFDFANVLKKSASASPVN